MQILLPLLVGAMVAASINLMLCRDLIRFIFGLVLAGNAVNLLILAAGRVNALPPPLIAEGQNIPAHVVANALPQALILTAIVIGFALLAFVFILFYRAYQELGTVDAEAMQAAESDPPDPSMETAP
jgi:multicomponent Na+:H+ antiporter subunit C